MAPQPPSQSSVRLTPAQRRHLTELAASGPYWYPNGSGERRCAAILSERGLLRKADHSVPSRVFEITAAGREAVSS